MLLKLTFHKKISMLCLIFRFDFDDRAKEWDDENTNKDKWSSYLFWFEVRIL